MPRIVTKAKAPAAKPSARMTLAEVAAFVVERVWPRSTVAEKRALQDRVRKRIERVVQAGELARNADGTFSRSRIDAWEVNTHWRGTLKLGPRQGVKPDGTFEEQFYINHKGKLVRQDGRPVRIQFKVRGPDYVTPLPFEELATIDACRAEITRLAARLEYLEDQLDKAHTKVDELNAKLAKRDAKREGGRKGAERLRRKKV